MFEKKKKIPIENERDVELCLFIIQLREIRIMHFILFASFFLGFFLKVDQFIFTLRGTYLIAVHI